MQDSQNKKSNNNNINAYILENTVFHARHIPISSKHVFTYPTLALLLRLSALESHTLDLCAGRLFGYSPAGSLAPWARVVGVRPEAYLHHDPNSYFEGSEKGKSVREKLGEVLMRFGIGGDEVPVEDVWMLTMPRYLGVEGINPLTVYFCYKKWREGGELGLWVVVLEVHNTFGERHVYVLRTGPEYEDKQVLPGYTHSWTFPRQFHVSPFNDRSGFYTCSLVPPPSSSSSSSLPPPLPKILIQLYTASNELKLTASLRTHSFAPLNTRNLLAALAKYPFTLLLSFPRIAWQAFHLHYALRLDVYARPEPRAVDPALERRLFSFSEGLVGDSKVEVVRNINDVQRKDGELGVGGGVGWQSEGLLERFARRRVERFLKTRVWEIGVKIRLVSTNPGYKTKVYAPYARTTSATTTECEQELTILTRSARAFLLILASPSPAHALLLARDAEQLMAVSDEKFFLQIFSLPSSQRGRDDASSIINTNIIQRTLQTLRKLPIPHSLQHDPELPIPDIHPLDINIDVASTDAQKQHQHPSQLFLPQNTNAISTLQTLAILTAFLALTYLEKTLFSILCARFVRGTEPWGMWARAEGVWMARRVGKEEGEES